MFWVYILSPLAAVLLLLAFVNWRTKQRYKKYNQKYELEEHVSDQNKINNAAAWNSSQQNHHSGGGGGGF
jgi:Flp pilus assembly protein TadB